MNDLNDHLPVHLMIFKGEDDVADQVLLAEITDRDNGRTEIAFDWNGRRYYVGMKTDDLRAAVPVSAVQEPK